MTRGRLAPVTVEVVDPKEEPVLTKAFEVHVRGELTREALDELGHFTATVVPTETVLTGVVPDQAALLGLLNRLHSLGLEVTEIRGLPEAGGS